MSIKLPKWDVHLSSHTRPQLLLDRVYSLYPDWKQSHEVRNVLDAGSSIGITTLVYCDVFPNAFCIGTDIAANLGYSTEIEPLSSDQYSRIKGHYLNYDYAAYEHYKDRLSFMQADFYNLPHTVLKNHAPFDLICADNNLSYVLRRQAPKPQRNKEFLQILTNLSNYLNLGGVIAINATVYSKYCFFIKKNKDSFSVKVLPSACTDTHFLAEYVEKGLNRSLTES